MNEVMTKSELFCLKNWETCSNTLEITVTVFKNGTIGKTLDIDLTADYSYNEELYIKKGDRILFIGLTNNIPDDLTGFTVALKTASGNIKSAGLEYYITEKVNAFKGIASDGKQLVYDLLSFERDGDKLNIDFSLEGCRTAKAEPDLKPVDDRKTAGTESLTRDDLIEAAKADLRILSYYGNVNLKTDTYKKLSEALENESIYSDEQLEVILFECEKSLASLITGTSKDIQKYREHI